MSKTKTKPKPKANLSPRIAAPLPKHSAGAGALLAAAEQRIQAGQLEPAADLLRQVLALDAGSPPANNLLAILALMRTDSAAAVDHARRAVERAPRDPSLQFTLGRAFKAAGELDRAVATYRRAIELHPSFAEAHVSLGIALKAQGDLEAAIACYERAIRINPQLAVAHSNLGAALALRAERKAIVDGDDALPTDEMIEAQQRAAALDPHDPEVQRNLGAILLRAGRPADAMHAFNAALTIDPTDLESCMHFGKCLVDLGDHGLARGLYEKWLAGNDKNAKVMRALANALTMLGESDAGIDWAERSLELEANPITAMQLGNSLLQARRIPEGVARCREGIDQSGRDVALYPVLLMAANYLYEDPQPIFDAHAELSAQLAPLLNRQSPRQRSAGDRLRVGYVSGDFVRHSVAFFISPLFAHHDRARFEVFCYHNNPRSDAVTERLKSFGHRWVESAHLSDNALDRRIRADGIDILIDLTGQTANSRMMVFARGPAPVQVGYLGYPTVSGVPAMDWRITDQVIDPGDQPAFESDRPLALPRSMFCYQPDADAPDVAPPPMLRNGYLTFGSFNNIAKVTDHTLELWAAAMNAVSRSHLLLKSASMAQASNRADIEGFMAARGIEASRLRLHGRQAADSDHLALYNEVDIALDTFPYNGATTTCEALWMGLPVISMRGRTHTSRMGASILAAIGRSDCVAHDDDGFARLAATLAADAEALARWRTGARSHLAHSALCDGPGFARSFEHALEQAWASHVDGGSAVLEPRL
ncbi:MAG: tetratricopeptide repeat protein [Burkholderiales bacterium]